MVTGDRLAGKTRGEGSGNVLGNRTASNVRKQGRGRDLRKIAAQQGSHQERKTKSRSGDIKAGRQHKLSGPGRWATGSRTAAVAVQQPAKQHLSSKRGGCANQASLTSNRHSQQVGGRF